MTASELRGLTTAGPVLACSPVELVAADGRSFDLVGWGSAVPTATDKEGREVPAGVPTLRLMIRERPATPAEA